MDIAVCENLALGYDGRPIIENLNFSIEEGDYFCIVGENGAGKSTLMKTLLHLQPALSGTIRLAEGLKHSDIGYLPQQTMVQKDFPASVREIVISGCQGGMGFRPFYNASEKALANQAMEKMGISHLEKRCYRELSGGQQQRVLLARAFCAAKKVLLLDEPVAGLDPKVSEDMYNLIQELNEKDGITIIMISHDIQMAAKYARHILHIGKSFFYGTTEDYIRSEIGKDFSVLMGGQA